MATGLATISKSKLKAGGGTLAYEAPEVLDDEGEEGEDPYTTKADVYSFGIFAWETVTGLVPWEGKAVKAIYRAVCLKDQNLTYKSSHLCSTATAAQISYITAPSSRMAFYMLFEQMIAQEEWPSAYKKYERGGWSSCHQAAHPTRRSMLSRTH